MGKKDKIKRPPKPYNLEEAICYCQIYIEDDDWAISLGTMKEVLSRWVNDFAPKMEKGKKMNMEDILNEEFLAIEKYVIHNIVEAEMDYLRYINVANGEAFMLKLYGEESLAEEMKRQKQKLLELELEEMKL